MKKVIEKYEFQCYCCGYFTIEERGHYEICDVCFWEDDGSNILDEESGPNYMTLEEGRKNFAKFGACEERFTIDVEKNPENKFRRGAFDA
ncbi:CPCC family cysteine-rich protein [Chryseobacterium sp. JUb7]|uniref:CPCC family cysteine-rich protein n=1 Tax=Chryseobacterium sp. JUb7 TaxID=2940599 RepID=UPI00216A8BEC|nr:CPCC family cysteine-rich protein [Chryseobacterium sp. JUb7]MCS3530123.1 hypothetical protein [Chryseobacterium sp. JUb7]